MTKHVIHIYIERDYIDKLMWARNTSNKPNPPHLDWAHDHIHTSSHPCRLAAPWLKQVSWLSLSLHTLVINSLGLVTAPNQQASGWAVASWSSFFFGRSSPMLLPTSFKDRSTWPDLGMQKQETNMEKFGKVFETNRKQTGNKNQFGQVFGKKHLNTITCPSGAF